MKKRKLGKSTLEVLPLSFGGNVFGWTIDEKQSFVLLDSFAEAGFNFVDTADVYARWVPGNQGGESETILGRWMKLRGNRKQMIIATKVGMEMGPNQKGLSKKYIFEAVDKSLKRLQTDYIDLYQSHRDDPDTPLQETLEAYAQLIEQGKIRYIGASNYTGERLAQALEISQKNNLPTYQTLQPRYNLYDHTEFETTLQPLCVEKNISVIPYYSLAAGFLTGKYRSEKDFAKSARGQNMSQYMNDKGMRILTALDLLAKEYGVNPAQISLAWLAAQPSVAAPIASATQLEQLKDLIASTRLELKPASIAILNQANRDEG